MFKTIKTILKIKSLKKNRVSDGKFIKDLRMALEEHIKINPAEEKNINYYKQSVFAAKLKLAPVLTMALVFVILSSTGAAVASQNSLPGNPLYPIKIITENIRAELTMNPRLKVELQTQFASERLSEIQKISEQKKFEDVKSELDAALSNFQDNLDKAAKIVEGEKNKGKDVGDMAGVLSRKIDTSAENIHQIFTEQKQTLKSREQRMKAEMEAARISEDAVKLQDLNKRINTIQEQKSFLDDKKETLKSFIENKEEVIQKDLKDRDKAENILNYAKREKKEIIDEAADKNIIIGPDRFTAIDKLINDSQSSFESGNYNKAKELAEQAKTELKKLEQEIEQETEEAIKGAREENKGENEDGGRENDSGSNRDED